MQRSGNHIGAILTTVSALAFIINDAAMKWAIQVIPLFELLFMRGLIAVPLICLAMLVTRQLIKTVSWADGFLIGWRLLAEIAISYFLLVALKNMPISHVTLILQAAPLGLTLVAALMMGEKVSMRRWVAILFGFVGVIIIIRPGTAGFSPYAIFAVLTVLCIVFRDMVTRRLSPTIPSLPIAALTTFVILLMAMIMMPKTGSAMPTLSQLLIITIAAVAILTAYLLSVKIMRVGDVGFVAQFRYTGIVWAVIIGFFVFGEVPDMWTVAGALLIMATGIYTLRADR
ncbi:MAG: DMT family transporter [Alphaproteobacteria bacterium]